MAPTTRYARTPRGDIAYQVIGDGPLDLVRMHTGHVDLLWGSPLAVHALERLASFSRLILLDRRGSGASDPVPYGATPTWEEYASDLETVLDEVGSERAALFASLDSGPTAMLFAATRPERTAALVLENTAARTTRAEDYPLGFTPEELEAILQLFEDKWGTEEFAAMTAPDIADDPTARAYLAMLQRAVAPPRTYAGQLRGFLGVDLRSVLSTINTQTLVLNRRDSPIAQLDFGRYIAEHIPDAKLVELDGANLNHIFSRDVDTVIDTVEEFLTGVRPSPTNDRVLATVLFTDLVDSTRRAAEMGDRDWRAFLDMHDRLAQDTVAASRGRMLRTTGDGIMATFDSPGRAIDCAARLRAGLEEWSVPMRAGVHTGEMEVRGGDIAGIGVVIAARIGAMAEAGEILVSRTVVDLVAGSDRAFADRGTTELKGVPGTWQIYAAVSA